MSSQKLSLIKLGVLSLLLSNFISIDHASASTPACEGIFAPLASPQVNTLDHVNQTIADLAALRSQLDQANVDGSTSIAITALNSDYLKKERALVKYVDQHHIMTRTELIEKMKHEIQKLQGGKQNQDDPKKIEESRRNTEQKILVESVIDGSRAVMHRIEPGSFKMGEIGKQVEVTITKPFDLLTTPTTQLTWRKVAELATQKYPGKYHINANPSAFKGDLLPVETVYYDEIQVWIKALNELSAAGEPTLIEIIPDHKKGDVYRLPTEAEWEFVVRGRGSFNDNYYFGDQENKLGDYAWYYDNSGNKTQQVVQKMPLTVGDKEFYDMHGNVWELVSDGYVARPSGGVDPQGLQDVYAARTIRGGSMTDNAFHLKSATRDYLHPGVKRNDVGFRLARTAR